MPVLDLNIASNIYIWEITENEIALKNEVSLSDIEHDLIFSYTREQRRREMLATRVLLNVVMPNEHIHYSNKAPVLVNSNKAISISNSRNLVVIQLNDAGLKTGVDIQFFSNTVLRVKNKYLHKNEYTLIEGDNKVEVLNIIWSAKETLYKAFTENKLNFKKQIEIKEIKTDSVTGIIEREGVELPFELGMYLNKDFVLTWFIN